MFLLPPNTSLYKVILSSSITFCVVLLAAKFGQYLFFVWHTSPAVLWPATGIILAVLWIGGYYLTVPIFFALFVASYTSPIGNMLPMVITTPLAQVVAGTLGVVFLHRLKFDDRFNSLRSLWAFLVVITITTMIIPTVTTTVSHFFVPQTAPFYFSWMRAWAGYLFSSLLLFPFIVSWSKPGVFALSQYRRMVIELGTLYMLLLGSCYLIFWLRLESETLFLSLTLFFVAIFWVCYQFPNRIMNLTLVGVIMFSVIGLFMSPASDVALNVRLITSQLFFLILVPVAYTFSTLVQNTNEALRILAESNNKIEKESLNKSDFIAVLAHELRNPLAPLKSILEILESEPMSSDSKTLVSNAKMHVHTMQRLLDDLLDTTRMIHGTFRLQITRCNLCEMLHHCLEYTAGLYTERNHTIFLPATCNTEIWLDVDPVRFEQVIVNILNNAAKYMNPGGTAKLEYALVGDTVQINIIDTGVGISTEHLVHIFESFWQADKLIPSVSGGIGVGLSLTKQIVEMMGGTIEAVSAGLGQGTTFTVSLPLSSIREKVQTIPESLVEVAVTPMSILAVDDNQAAASALAKLLTLKGHSVVTSYSGKATVTLVREKNFEVVLLDIGLPDLDGFAVATLLRAEGYRGALVALSGYSQKEYIAKAEACGFDHYAVKPISIKVLEKYFRTLQEENRSK